MTKYMALVVLMFVAGPAWSDKPTCHTHSSGSYCSYVGKVSKLYINDQDTILLYFDAAFDVSDAHSVGFNAITTGAAAARAVSINPDFAKMLYSTALAAQSSGKDVAIQMRGNVGGYLKIDRIWISE